SERPSLRLAREAGRSDCEQGEPGAEREERTPDDPRLVRSGEGTKDEHEAKREPRGNRSKDDEPDMPLRRDLLSRAESGARRGGCGAHETFSFPLTLDSAV